MTSLSVMQIQCRHRHTLNDQMNAECKQSIGHRESDKDFIPLIAMKEIVGCRMTTKASHLYIDKIMYTKWFALMHITFHTKKLATRLGLTNNFADIRTKGYVDGSDMNKFNKAISLSYFFKNYT